MTLSFFRVEAQIRNYLGVIGRSHADSLDIILTDMRDAIIESKKEIAEYADFDGKDDLYEETLFYLSEIETEMNETLKPLAAKLENEFLDERDYRDAQKDLDKFEKLHQRMVEDFFETKRQLIEEYLPED